MQGPSTWPIELGSAVDKDLASIQLAEIELFLRLASEGDTRYNLQMCQRGSGKSALTNTFVSAARKSITTVSRAEAGQGSITTKLRRHKVGLVVG